jgi:hypothetical protein
MKRSDSIVSIILYPFPVISKNIKNTPNKMPSILVFPLFITTNVDKMVSTLQAQLFVWLASDRKARKILEIGCFSGTFSSFTSDKQDTLH